MLRHLTAAIAIVVSLATPATAQDEQAAIVLQAAREALKSYETLTFDAEFRFVGTGKFDVATRSSDTKATLARTETGVIARIEGRQGPTFGQPGIDFLAVREGTDARWLDEKERQVVMAYGLRESRKAPSAFEEMVPRDIFGEEPFRNLENEGTLAFGGLETIDGVDCDVLILTRARDNQEVRYAIARTDRLLRRIVKPFGQLDEFADSSVTETINYKNIKIDQPIDASIFEIETPPGYSVSQRGRVPAENRPAPRDRLVVSSRIGTDVGDTAPAFQATDTKGNEISLAQTLEAEKPTIVYFWSSWHPRCRSLNEELVAMIDDLGDRAPSVIGLAIRERDEAAASATAEGLGFPVVIGARDIADNYAVRAVPTIYVLNPDGTIAWVGRTYKKAETIEEIRGVVTASD